MRRILGIGKSYWTIWDFNEGGKPLAVNGDKAMKEEVGDEEELGSSKIKISGPRLPRFTVSGKTCK